MSKNMLGLISLSEFQGPRDDFEQKLAGEEGPLWLNEFKLFLRKEPCWVAKPESKLQPKPNPLLKWIGEVNVAATTKKFIAREKFVINTSDNAPVKISGLGSNFESWFLDKIEEPFAGSTLRFGKLMRWERDIPIINELGGEEKAETSRTELFAMMKLQPNGKKGILLTNGYANIFYIRDINGVLLAVSVGWFGDGWYVNADPLGDPVRWHVGYQVFSRRLLAA